MMAFRATRSLLIAILLLLLLSNNFPGLDNILATEALVAVDRENELHCVAQPADTLGAECRLLEVYNQMEVDKLSTSETAALASFCACRLANLDWESQYDDHPSIRRVEEIVRNVVNNETHRESYPKFLWSDMEVVLNGYSIYVSTKDYFEKRNQSASWAPLPAEQMRRDPVFREIRIVCNRVARDRKHLYQYLENLERLDPSAFFKLLHVNPTIDLIYQASKSCKMLVVHRLGEFKLRPTSRNFYAVEGTNLRDNELDNYNLVQVHDIDTQLRDSSMWLMKCHHWQAIKLSLTELESACPMMVASSTPSEWLERHPLPSNRAHLALKCGCQLLLHNGTWTELLKDGNVATMNKALTRYMNDHKLDNLNGETPLFSVYAWFTQLMENFEKNRRLSVKEIIKLKRNDRDPSDPINRLTGDEDEALELLRTGCNRIMFGHRKATKMGDQDEDDVRLIRYLDNLRWISQDPMFVFHLTLQDSNLFKLHALSKMCRPILS